MATRCYEMTDTMDQPKEELQGSILPVTKGMQRSTVHPTISGARKCHKLGCRNDETYNNKSTSIEEPGQESDNGTHGNNATYYNKIKSQPKPEQGNKIIIAVVCGVVIVVGISISVMYYFIKDNS